MTLKRLSKDKDRALFSGKSVESVCPVCCLNSMFPSLETIDINREISKERFQYLRCESCGSYFLNNIPKNLGDYYTKQYYSFSQTNNPEDNEEVSAQTKKTLKPTQEQLDKYYITGVGGVLVKFWSLWHYSHRCYKLIPHYTDKNSAILDVGCGDGYLLNLLGESGYTKLTGVDLYVPEDRARSHKYAEIIKGTAFDVEGKYDLIILRHSFEHMDEPSKVMARIFELLKDNGRVLISVPIANSRVFQKYGSYWFQLDAPRHLVINSVKGMEVLAEKSGMYLERVSYDSCGDTYWWSKRNAEKNGNNQRRTLLNGLVEKVAYIARGIRITLDNLCKKSDQASFVIQKCGLDGIKK